MRPRKKILGQGMSSAIPTSGTRSTASGPRGGALCSGEGSRLVEEYIVSRGAPSRWRISRPLPSRSSGTGRSAIPGPRTADQSRLRRAGFVAYSLALLERDGRKRPGEIARAMAAANEARDDDFAQPPGQEGFARRFLDDRLGSTTHLAAIDSDGLCASLPVLNGTGSGMVVPAPGFTSTTCSARKRTRGASTSPLPVRGSVRMMSPTLILEQGMVQGWLGSAGVQPDPFGGAADDPEPACRG